MQKPTCTIEIRLKVYRVRVEGEPRWNNNIIPKNKSSL